MSDAKTARLGQGSAAQAGAGAAQSIIAQAGMKKLKGVVVSMGIAIGPAHVCVFTDPVLEKKTILPAETEREVARFREAVEQLKAQYEQAILLAKEDAHSGAGGEAEEILEAQSLLLQDPMFIDGVLAKIYDEHVDAAYAVQLSMQEFAKLFAGIDDPIIAQRILDIEDVAKRLIRILYGVVGDGDVGSATLAPGDLVVADNILPTDFLDLDQAHMSAMVLDHGATTSHTAILAQAFGIPTVVGLAGQTREIAQGDMLIVDANKGEVIVRPDAETLACYEQELEAWEEQKAALYELRDLEAVTTDGHRIALKVNMEIPEEAVVGQQVGAEGVGLFRSEFAFMQKGNLLDEEEQFELYKRIITSMGDRGAVTLRTIDVGGDKLMSRLSFISEENPALGCRAIRYCMDNVPFFSVQLRAMLRASAYGPLSIMFPMVSGVDEFEEVLALLEEIKAELRAEGIAFDEDVAVGTMIEVPSAVYQARGLARLSDFVSIGTNDLIQYLLAVDRNNEKLVDLYEPYHPAVLYAIAHVVDAAHSENIAVSVCGEMAADPESALVLMGLGVDELSMNAYALPRVKSRMRQASYEKLRKSMSKVLKLDRISEIHQCIDESLEG